MLKYMEMFFLFALFLLTVAMLPLAEPQKSELTSLKFHQNGYKIVHDRLEVESYDKKWLSHTTLFCYWYNRTARAINFTVTLTKDVSSVKLDVQLYKFLSNEYRYFPLGFEFNFCSALQQDAFDFRSILKCGNFRTDCLFKKGSTYKFCNWLLDATKFPPYVPFGKYKLHLTLKFQSVFAANYSWYGSIQENVEWD